MRTVLSTLLDAQGEPTAEPEPIKAVEAGPLEFAEEQLLGKLYLLYGCAAADLDGDGDLDLTSADAGAKQQSLSVVERRQALFQTVVQFRNTLASQINPSDSNATQSATLNGDKLLDVVIVDSLKWAVRWYQNPGKDDISKPWKLHRVSADQEVPGSYDVAAQYFDGDGDLDVAASSWRFGNRFDFFENVGTPGNGEKWTRHEIDGMTPGDSDCRRG